MLSNQCSPDSKECHMVPGGFKILSIPGNCSKTGETMLVATAPKKTSNGSWHFWAVSKIVRFRDSKILLILGSKPTKFKISNFYRKVLKNTCLEFLSSLQLNVQDRMSFGVASTTQRSITERLELLNAQISKIS